MAKSDAEPIAGVKATAYTVPTDAPEADGTLSWNDTTMVVVQAHCGNAVGICWTYGSGASAAVVNGLLSIRSARAAAQR
jgi:hypothetical protein